MNLNSSILITIVNIVWCSQYCSLFFEKRACFCIVHIYSIRAMKSLAPTSYLLPSPARSENGKRKQSVICYWRTCWRWPCCRARIHQVTSFRLRLFYSREHIGPEKLSLRRGMRAWEWPGEVCLVRASGFGAFGFIHKHGILRELCSPSAVEVASRRGSTHSVSSIRLGATILLNFTADWTWSVTERDCFALIATGTHSTLCTDQLQRVNIWN